MWDSNYSEFYSISFASTFFESAGMFRFSGSFRICDLIIDQIIDWVKTKVVQKAMLKLATLFVPFAGLITAAKSLWQTIKFVKEKIDKFRELASSMLDVIGPAAKGNAGPAAEKMHQTLAKAVPLAIEWFATLVGLGDIDNKVRSLLDKVQEPVNVARGSTSN